MGETPWRFKSSLRHQVCVLLQQNTNAGSVFQFVENHERRLFEAICVFFGPRPWDSRNHVPSKVDPLLPQPYNSLPCCCGVEQSGSSTGS